MTCTISSTQFQEAYTTAIALNNVGVLLLQRHRYGLAHDAFKNALQAMRNLSKPTGDMQSSSLHFDAVLRRAYCILSQNSMENVEDDSRFRIITEGESADVIAAAVQESTFFNFSTTFLIRIELEGKSILECQGEDMKMESCIIMYNYAVLYMCRAPSEPIISVAFQRLQ